MKKFKNQKGVTLVALVVTIIVLIILAGISINLVLGDNGIITIAKKAKENTELARVEEETELNELYTQLESSGTSSGGTNYDAIAKLTEFKTAIANAIDEAGGIKPDTTAETAVFADNIKGILKEVTKDATATEDDILEGKTAYVNGKLITGKNKKKLYLYKDGNEYTENSGGWNFSKVENRNSSFSKESNYLYLNSTPDSAAGYFYTINKNINIANYNKLCIKSKICKTGSTAHFSFIAGQIIVNSNNSIDYSKFNDGKAIEFKDSTSYCYTERNFLTTDINIENNRNLVLDISEINTVGGIYIYAYNGYEKIYEVWLEE